MKTAVYKPLAIFAIFIMMISLACTLGASPTSQPSPTEAATKQAKSTKKPTTEEVQVTAAPKDTQAAASSEGAITNRDDVEKAVIRIVAQGSFVDPQYGSVEGIGSGSGFIIDPSGIAITNNHVVTGAALIKVYFSGDDTAHNAKILGVSECSDLAVIDIEGDGFPYLTWHDAAVKVGMEVWSAGYPLGDPQYSFHRGVISKAKATPNTGRGWVTSAYEHDATINPGNSGGPLVDDNGQVVGVNFAGSNVAANEYYAIAKAEVDPILKDLEGGKNVTSLGVNGNAVQSDDGSVSGIWVSSVASGSPADKAGLQGGDLITQMEGVTMGAGQSMKDYCDILRSHKDTDTLSLKVVRLASGEILDGQVNGRVLAVTGKFDTSSTSPTDAPSGNTNGQTTGGTPSSFTDDFSKDQGNWETFDGGKISQGVYLLGQFADCADVGSETAFGCFTQCLTCGLANTFKMQVDAAYMNGVTDRTFGMVLRFVDNNDNGLVDKDDYYLDFELSIYDQYFIVWEHRTDGKWYKVDDKIDSSILPGQHVNTLGATAYNGGSDMDITLNGNVVETISSIPYDSGTVGLVVGGRAMQAAFDNFEFTVQ